MTEEAVERDVSEVPELEETATVPDSLASGGSDELEQKPSVLEKSPQQTADMMKTTSEPKLDTAKSPAVSSRSCWYSSAVTLLDNKYGLILLDVANWALFKTNYYLQQYLPGGEDKTTKEENQEGETEEKPIDVKVKNFIYSVTCIFKRTKHNLNLAVSRLKDTRLQKVFTSAADLLQSVKETACIVAAVERIKCVRGDADRKEGEYNQLKPKMSAMTTLWKLACYPKLLYVSMMTILQAMYTTFRMIGIIALVNKTHSERLPHEDSEAKVNTWYSRRPCIPVKTSLKTAEEK